MTFYLPNQFKQSKSNFLKIFSEKGNFIHLILIIHSKNRTVGVVEPRVVMKIPLAKIQKTKSDPSPVSSEETSNPEKSNNTATETVPSTAQDFLPSSPTSSLPLPEAHTSTGRKRSSEEQNTEIESLARRRSRDENFADGTSASKRAKIDAENLSKPEEAQESTSSQK